MAAWYCALRLSGRFVTMLPLTASMTQLRRWSAMYRDSSLEWRREQEKDKKWRAYASRKARETRNLAAIESTVTDLYDSSSCAYALE